MKGKIFFVAGLFMGYVLGTRAGRERYEQIKRGWKKILTSEPVQVRMNRVQDFGKRKLSESILALLEAAKTFIVSFRRASHEVVESVSSGSSAESASDGKGSSNAGSHSGSSTSSRPAGTSKTSQSGALRGGQTRSSGGTTQARSSNRTSQSAGDSKKRSDGS